MLNSHKPPQHAWASYARFQNVTQDFVDDVDSDIFSVVPTSRPIKLISLGRKPEPPSDAELFSGDFSLLPVAEGDLEEKHIIGVMDRVICAVAAWILGNGRAHETICSCLYMRLTQGHVEAQNNLGKCLLLFVEGVRRVYSMVWALTHNNDHREDFLLEDNPFPPSEWESYYAELEDSIAQLGKKADPTELDKAIRTRLVFVKTLALMFSWISGESEIRPGESKDDLPELDAKEYDKDSTLGEEPVGSFSLSGDKGFVPVFALESSPQLPPIGDAVKTFKAFRDAVLSAINSAQDDPAMSVYTIVEWLPNGANWALRRALIARAVIRAVSGAEALRVSKPLLASTKSIKILEVKTKKNFDDIFEDINRCWESTLGLLHLNDGRLYDSLPQCILQWEKLYSISKKNGFQQGVVYTEHVESFCMTIYIMLGCKLSLYTQKEYRFTLWILVNMYKRMIPGSLQAQEPKHSSDPEFWMRPDLAFIPPLPKDLSLKPNASHFNKGNIIYSNFYLTYLMAQQLCIMGELALHRGLLSNALIRENAQRDEMEKLFKYRLSSIKGSNFEKELKFGTFLSETDFYNENFDVLYKRSIGYFRKSISLFNSLPANKFADVFAMRKMMEKNIRETSALLGIPERGLSVFKKKKIILFEPKDTLLPVLTIKDAGAE